MEMRKKGSEMCVKDVVTRNTGLCASDFLHGSKRTYAVTNMKAAIKLLWSEMSNKTFIFVMADYDVDGVSSGCIFEILFRAARYENYRIRFPKRFSEGYGIRESVIDEIPEGSLLITVDNGIAAIGPVKKAKEKGIKVLIVDHHQPITKDGEFILPEADVIVDPHATGNCDFNYYCGAGLAYKLCSSFIESGHKTAMKMLVFACMATIADVMPLIEENRRFVKAGLKLLTQPEARTTGLYALLKAFGMERYITESDIGYYIAPSINAMSRMNDDGARMAFEALTFEGRLDEAEALASNMHQTNQDRKELVELSRKLVNQTIFSAKLDQDIPMVVYLPGLHEGIIGIIAGNLAEDYKRPVLVFTDCGENLKGSGRTYGGVNLYNLLNECTDLFLGWGGHAEAAGMTIAPENLEKLRNGMKAAFINQKCMIEGADDTYDLEIDITELPMIIPEIDRFRPYGQGNPEIRLLIHNYKLKYNHFARGYIKKMGKEQQHVKFYGEEYDAIAFQATDRYEESGAPLDMDVVGVISKNHYVDRYGDLRISDQIEVIDFDRAPKADTRTDTARELDDFALSLFQRNVS